MQGILNFLVSYFQTYDIVTEVVMIVLILLMYAVMRLSKPERTLMMTLFYAGLKFALLVMISHIFLLGATISMRTTHNNTVFNNLYVLYSILYVCVMECIILYQANLSYKQRFHKKPLIILCIVSAIIWLIVMLYPLFKNLLLEYNYGNYDMSCYSDCYVLCSFSCAIIVAIITFINRKSVSRIVLLGTSIFVPLELIAITAQLYFHTAYFICTTYTLPFLVYYILFHAQKYDDITGCQGHASYRSHLNRFIKYRKDFVLLSVSAPDIESRNYSDIEHIVINICNDMARALERLDGRIRVYSISNHSYRILCQIKDDLEGEYIEQKIIDILSEPVQINNRFKKIPMNILVSKRYDSIVNADEYLMLQKLKFNSFSNLGIDQIIKITDEDAIAYKRYQFIEKNLLDIKYKKNLEDDRVITFIQPIYDIHSDSFKTGESLMRLKINGNMIYPDEFIPIAERSGCIHALTRIMLYKVAKHTAELCSRPGFQAITVNVSTIEMIEPNVCEEFMGIIRCAKAKPENIRLEITESTKVLDYSRVIENINRLNEMGISFYLDDFGTGYSNLDRVISLPFETIKFDKSLMYKALEDKNTDELFKFLASFFKKKGFSLVVEGVETEIHRDYVKAAGLDYIQGYLYSKPIPAEDAYKFYK